MSRKSRTQSAPSVVEKLIEQRRLIQEWLTRLADGGTEAMPAHVVERVRNDYTARLAGVTKELGEHADGVRQNLDEQQARHAELDKEQTARRDELAELKLRRQVGELEEGRYKDQSQRLKSAIDDLTKDLTASARDIDRLEEILDSMERQDEEPEEAPGEDTPAMAAAPAAEEQAEAAAEAEAEDDEEPEPADDAPVAAEAPAAAEPPAPSPAPPPPAAAGPAPPEKPATSAPEKAAPQGDELSFLRSVTGVISAVKPPPPKEKEKDKAEQGTEGEKPFYVLEQMPEAPAAAPPRASKGDKPAEGERTLKCGECGTKNLPTEWYCEKCGAELTNF